MHAIAPAAARPLAGLRAGGDRHTLSDLLTLFGRAQAVGADTQSFPVPVRSVRMGATLFHEGSSAESVYAVSAGSFKCFRTAADGFEQVLSFVGRAELLGFDAICMGQHPTTAIALEDSRVYALRAADVFDLNRRVPAFAQVLQAALGREFKRQAETAYLMAAVSAEVRLARLLLQLSERMASIGQSPRRLYLRMCRRDIASHLGVAHETVSRSFSALVDCGCLHVNNRDVEILDLARLGTLALSTRGTFEEAMGAADGRTTGHVSRPAPVPQHEGEQERVLVLFGSYVGAAPAHLNA